MATTKSSEKKTGSAGEQFQVQLTFNPPIEKPSVYATNILIQEMEHEVLLSFYEIQPPLLGGTPEQNVEVLKKTGMRADCVAKVIVSKARISGFSNAIKQAVDEINKTAKK